MNALNAMDIDSPRPPELSTKAAESLPPLQVEAFFSRPELFKRPSFLTRKDSTCSISSDSDPPSRNSSNVSSPDRSGISGACRSPLDPVLENVAYRLSQSTITEREEEGIWAMEEDATHVPCRPPTIHNSLTAPTTRSFGGVNNKERQTKRKVLKIDENSNKITNYFTKAPSGTPLDVSQSLPAKPDRSVQAESRTVKIGFSITKPNVLRTKRKSNDITCSPAIKGPSSERDLSSFKRSTNSLSSWQFKKPIDVNRSSQYHRSFRSRKSDVELSSPPQSSDDEEYDDEETVCEPSPTRPRRRYTRSATAPIITVTRSPTKLFPTFDDAQIPTRPASATMPMRTPSPSGARKCAAIPIDVPSRRGQLMRPAPLSLITGDDLAASPDSLQIISALNCGYGANVFKQPDRNPFL
ncbi:uncharacterized protein SPPG_03198 [Spizellomyces punctatus DAOM BR117]|uniref:Uncharacterized protein n=1 Tax=Spizellomyces punctatus (strain DAOM BR117) TaxID=645134 RepID=A0A0L0HJU0_SPIPD|nr:uncharacterized protein SPPG_03198 [Spizellomyces punctatus DAOM BR117]KND01387.1 hypothetical protein SPPG_03198 [Spizellomyces punctatus DAOM BR117]|eukprot:XP_016609426.1 hypothetical protein SPPG_03198 [Spizellomyces punctatus DAOM BR117]